MQHKVNINEINEQLKAGKISEAAKLIQNGVVQRIDFRGGHLTCANVLLVSAPWDEISALLPPRTNSFVTSGWVKSVAMGRPVDQSGNAIPWLTYPAIELQKKTGMSLNGGLGIRLFGGLLIVRQSLPSRITLLG
jgi:hypothetical protein